MTLEKYKRRYRLDASKTTVPDCGLGNFVVGYSSRKRLFLWAYAFFNLIPAVGSAIFLIYLLWYWSARCFGPRDEYFFYDRGLRVRKTGLFGKVKSDDVYPYAEYIGFKAPLLENPFYTEVGRHERYYVDLNLYATPYERIALDDTRFRRAGDFPNVLPRVMEEMWRPVLVARYEEELRTAGRVTFYEEGMPIEIGPGYVKVRDVRVDAPLGSQYDDEGLLNIWRKGGKCSVRIYDANIVNRALFAEYLQRLTGIETEQTG